MVIVRGIVLEAVVMVVELLLVKRLQIGLWCM